MVHEELGWSVVDVEQFVGHAVGPNVTTVATGGFDETTLVGLTEVDGIYSAGNGADYEADLAQSTPARPGGAPLRLAVSGNRLVASPDTAIVQQWLDGSGPTLADEGALAGIARLLDRAGVYAAMFSAPTSLFGQPLPIAETVLEALGVTRKSLPRYDTYAIGWAVGAEGPEITVVYHVAGDVDRAREQVAKRWRGTTLRGADIATLVSLEGVDVDGQNVIVSLTPASDRGPNIVYLMADGEDLPFLVE